MAYTNPPYGKGTVQDVNTVPFFTAMRDAIPSQASSAIGHEAQESGEIFRNLQFTTSPLIYYVRGTPEEVADSDLFGGMNRGDPHPLADQGGVFRSMFQIDSKFLHHSFGAAGDDTTNFGQAWTKVILTYQSRQCLNKPAVSGRSASVVYNEWYYTDPDDGTVKRITQTMETVPILRPVKILILHWDRIFLTDQDLLRIESNLDRLNPEVFFGANAEDYLFDGESHTLLYEEDPSSNLEDGWYELTLTFRRDRLRQHQWWEPRRDSQTGRPIAPELGVSLPNMHIRRKLYITGTPFDQLVPGGDLVAECVPGN